MTEVHVFEIADVFFTILKYVSYKDAISKITRICKSCYKMMHDDRAYQLLTLAINPIAQLPNGGNWRYVFQKSLPFPSKFGPVEILEHYRNSKRWKARVMDLLNGELHLWEYDTYPHKKHEFRLKISETDKIQQISHKPNEFEYYFKKGKIGIRVDDQLNSLVTALKECIALREYKNRTF